MRNYIRITFAFLVIPFIAIAQTTTENYSKSTSYQNPYDIADITSGNVAQDDKIESVTYFDGMGRPIQSVAQRVGGNRETLTTHIAYDEIGRQNIDYLPLPTTGNDDGKIYTPTTQPSIELELKEYYSTKFPEDFYMGNPLIPNYDNPYSKKVFEDSPLNRVLEQGAPGFDWHPDYNGHTVKFGYQTNAVNQVKHFKVAFGADYSDPSFVDNGFYSDKELYKNVTKDENWIPTDGDNNTTHQFTDKKGQTVLSRAFNNSEVLDTYYVYDDHGNLTYVLSPEATKKILEGAVIATVLADLCYQYKYDHRGRIFEKKIAGKGWEKIIYDKLDRPILTQDPIQALNNQWYFTKYDAFGRVAYTGILFNFTQPLIETGMNLSGLQLWEEQLATNPLNINGTTIYYSNDAFPNDTANMEVLTVNYYDTYVDHATINIPLTVSGVNTTQHSSVVETTIGLPTVSKVKVLDSSPADWITSVLVYDKKGRTIETISDNPLLDTRDVVRTTLDFTGKPIESHSIHARNGNATINIRDYFHHDHMGRLLSHKQKLDDSPVQLIADNTYDELGRMVAKNVGGESFADGYTDLQHVEVTHDGTITNTWSGGSSTPWPSLLKTKGKIPKNYDGGISFSPAQNHKFAVVGLTNTSSLNQNNNYVDFGILLHYLSTGTNNVQVKLWVNGLQFPNASTDYGAYNPGDEFKVERIGNLVTFYKNGTILDTVNVNPSIELVGKVSFTGTGGAIINDLTLFGPKIDKVLQEVDYRYNVRGWLTDINDLDYSGETSITDLFQFGINYNLTQGTTNATPLFNGNISQTHWKSDNTDKDIRGYDYSYDPLNRLTLAQSTQGTSTSNLAFVNTYNLSNVQYDLNGNIQTLNRLGKYDVNSGIDAWDVLTYEYSGNRLTKVEDTANNPLFKNLGFKNGASNTTEYLYDVNGNMVTDDNKGITFIDYNHLNLPVKITVAGTQSGTIDYIYDAMGTKLKKIFTQSGNSKTTEYANGFVYNDNSGLMLLQFFPHPEGYIEPTPVVPLTGGDTKSVKGFDSSTGQTTYSLYQYVFQYTDHLGNVRLSYTDSDLNGAVNSSEIIEESHYYPFGLKQLGYNPVINGGNDIAQQWKYNGTELNNDLDLNLYEMPLRKYDPALGRWFAIDPVTHYSMSPYVAFDNNPILWADPSGADAGAGLSQAVKDHTGGSSGSNEIVDTGKWEHEGGGIYRNNSTGETTDDSFLAISETTQHIPDAIDFVNGSTNVEKFTKSVINWFGFIKKYGDKFNISPVHLIDHYAKPDKEPSFGKKVIDFIEDAIGGDSADHNKVVLNDGNGNFVSIGYHKFVYENAGKYIAKTVDFEEDNKTNRYRISIRSQPETAGNVPQAMIYMYFYGKDRTFYDDFKTKINDWEYKSVPLIKKLKD